MHASTDDDSPHQQSSQQGPRGRGRPGGNSGRPDKGTGAQRGRFAEREGRGGTPRGGRAAAGQRGTDSSLSREDAREVERVQRPGLGRRADEPPTPTDIDERVLPRAVRAELRGLPKDLASIVAAHLVMAGELIDEDPDRALAHAHAARRRAARLPVVREATAETAYAAGDWATALSEYRALQRMSGAGDFLPVMADCERALGRPREALKLARQAARANLDAAMEMEMAIVEAGARADLGEVDEALRVLRAASSSRRGSREAHARVAYAAGDLLERQGRVREAGDLFGRASDLDEDETLDAPTRLARLGVGLGLGQDLDIISMIEDADDLGDEGPEGPGESTAPDTTSESSPR